MLKQGDPRPRHHPNPTTTQPRHHHDPTPRLMSTHSKEDWMIVICVLKHVKGTTLKNISVILTAETELGNKTS